MAPRPIRTRAPGRSAVALAAGLAAGVALAVALRPRAGGGPPARAAAPELRRAAQADGVRMRWEEHGDPDGRPIVLVHGLPTSPRVWRHVVPRLAGPGRRVLAPS
jgi:hypothetical protein